MQGSASETANTLSLQNLDARFQSALGVNAGLLNTVTVSTAVRTAGHDAHITAGTVTIAAAATDVPAGEEVPAKANSALSDFYAVLNKVSSVAVAKLPVDLSVVLRGANAGIAVDGSTIIASGSVSITGTTKVETGVKAIVQDVAGQTGVQVAAGFGEATTVNTAVITGSTITAGTDVTVGTTAKLSNSVSASAAYSTTDSNTTTKSLALVAAYTNLVSRTTVDAASNITAAHGSINVYSDGTDKTSPSATTSAASDGTAGISASFAYDTADVKVTLSGQATASGGVTAGSPLTFNGAGTDKAGGTVNASTATFTVKNHGLTDGEQVTYEPGNLLSGVIAAGSGTKIGGLTAGETYYVHYIDQDNFQLTLAPSLALDPSGDSATSNQTFSKVSDAVFALDAIDGGQHSVRLARHGFSEGDAVTYTAANGTAISGLASGGSYAVHVVDDSKFQLLQNGVTVAISQGAALGEQLFTVGGTVRTLNLASVDAANNAIMLAGHGIPDGAVANYTSLEADGLNPIGGLSNDTNYTVRVLDANRFQLLDTNKPVVAISDPQVASVQAIAFVAQTFTFAPTATVVNSQTNTVTLPYSNLQTGDQLIYGVDPSVTRTLPVNVEADGVRQASTTLMAQDRAIGGLQNGGVYVFPARAGMNQRPPWRRCLPFTASASA